MEKERERGGGITNEARARGEALLVRITFAALHA